MELLSIDWDYFIDADANYKGKYFPDGGNENLPSMLQDFIWQDRYAQSIIEGKDIREIKVRKEYYELCDYLRHEKISLYEIAESHKDYYYFLKRLRQTGGLKFSVTNIDFHHDLRPGNTNDKIDCGNWLRRVKEDGLVNGITWIGCEDSDKLENEVHVIFTTDLLSRLKYGKYTAVFICRSRVWSPPHLDDKLFKMHDIVNKRSTIIQKQQWEARWDRIQAGLDANVRTLKNMIKKCEK